MNGAQGCKSVIPLLVAARSEGAPPLVGGAEQREAGWFKNSLCRLALCLIPLLVSRKYKRLIPLLGGVDCEAGRGGLKIPSVALLYV